MNPIERIYQRAEKPAAFADGYIRHLTLLLASLDRQAIGRFIEALMDAREREATIYFIGNGGSAATASHFANDIGIGTGALKKPFRAVSLCDNNAVMTAIANDFGYEQLFVRQLQTRMLPGDVVVAISASGNSPNVIRAIDWANAHEAVTVGLTGFDGGSLMKAAQIGVHVATEKGEYGPVEDVHMVLDHLAGGYLLCRCRAEATTAAVATAEGIRP